MVAILSTFVVSGFVLVTLYAGIVTVLQYGHMVGPTWRMEGAEPRGALVSMRGQRQVALVRTVPTRPVPKVAPRLALQPTLQMAA
jgi:hypothetical protein